MGPADVEIIECLGLFSLNLTSGLRQARTCDRQRAIMKSGAAASFVSERSGPPSRMVLGSNRAAQCLRNGVGGRWARWLSPSRSVFGPGRSA